MQQLSFKAILKKSFLSGIFILGVCTVVIGQAQKPSLLIFSGSDWCLPCINFDRQVRQDPAFIAFIEENLSVEVLDFPQKTRLPKDQVAYNEQMAEKYNPNGYFPYVLLVDETRNLKVRIKTANVSAKQVIAEIQPYVSELKEFSASLILMGSSFNITLVARQEEGEHYLQECITTIKSIESWMSAWQPNSITSLLNKKAAIQPIQVPEEYYQLLARSINLSLLTQGAFDISFTGIHDLYQFDQQEQKLPDQDILKDKLDHVGVELIELLPENKVFFKDSLLAISFGAIGKGYAADRVKKQMLAKGVQAGVVNASGDLTTWGTRSNGAPWRVGIPDPFQQETIIMWLPLNNKAIATSGDAEKYFMCNGQRYSHIINPKTGMPVVGARSVSVISESGELSDALATAVSVLGIDIGLNLINQIDDVECIFIDNNSKLHFSNGLQPNE